MKKKRSSLLTFLLILLPLVLVLYFFNGQNFVKVSDASYTDVVSMVYENKVSKLQLNNGGKLVYTERDTGKSYSMTIGNPDYFYKDINSFVLEHNTNNKDAPDQQIIVEYNKSNSLSVREIVLIIVCGIAILLFVSALRRIGANAGQGGGAFGGFGQAKIRQANSTVKFADVAGADEEKEELKEVVSFLKDPKKYNDVGARVPKGVLLVGPPGTGKTLLARAVAGESGVPFLTVSGSDFMEMFVGVGAARIRNLFEQAKKSAPCIVFIDELDAVAGKRGGGPESNNEREQTLNQLLVEMDGFSKNQDVIIMAATNRPEALDKAILRPGRFDRQIVVNLPDMKGRLDILNIYAKNKTFADNVDMKEVASMTSGYSGADLENLLNEAVLIAIRDNRTVITNQDIDNAILKVVIGTEKKSHIVTEEDKKITAVHETGHAVVSHFLPSKEAAIQQISVIPRGLSAGFTMYKPKTDNNHVSKSQLLDNICSMLAGRAAEEILIGEVCTGASSDIERATHIARAMVTELGMSEKVGNFHLVSKQGTFLKQSDASYVCSDEFATIADKEIQKILETQYLRAQKIILQHQSLMWNITNYLLKNEKMSGEMFDEIMANYEKKM